MPSKITNLKILSCEVSQLGIFSFLRLIYGNFRSRFQYFVRNVRNLFSGCNLSFLCAIGLSLSPLLLRAEFDSQDSANLDSIRNYMILGSMGNFDWYSVEQSIEATSSNLVKVRDAIGVTGSYSPIRWYLQNYYDVLGYGTGSTQKGTIYDSLTTIDNDLKGLSSSLGYSNTDTLKMQLDQIIAALETINTSIESGSGSGSGSGSDTESINQDWVKETTFTTKVDALSAKYEELANRAYNVFGFNQEETFKDYLGKIFYPAKDGIYTSVVWSEEGTWDSTPFPNERHGWGNFYTGTFEFGNNGNIVRVLSEVLSSNLEGTLDGITWNFKKQSWNDWYAHTNLVSTLETIFSRSDFDQEKEGLSYDSERGVLTLTNTGGTGSADESYSVTPVSTNSVDTAVTAITSSSEKVPLVYDKETVLNRYLNEGILSAGQNYGTDETGSQSSIVWRTSWWIIDFGEISRKYRSAITVSDLARWRGYTEVLWQIVSVVCCILLVRKFGNM